RRGCRRLLRARELAARHELRARSDHELLAPLLENMRYPTRHSAIGQETAGRIAWRTERLADRDQRMIHAGGALLESHERPIARSGAGGKPFGDLGQSLGPRIAIAVEWIVQSARLGSSETFLQQIATESQCRAKMDLKCRADAGMKVVSR